MSYGERAVNSDTDNPEHHVVLGDACFRAGRLDEARAHWTTADALGSPRAKKRLAKLGS